MKKYYELPVQVEYYDTLEEEWSTGIAFHDQIICGCCGGIFEVAEVIEFGRSVGIAVPIIQYPNWKDLTKVLKGEV